MHWRRPAAPSDSHFIALRLCELREHLGDLASQVRVAVADAIAAALARVARDAVEWLLHVRPAELSRPGTYHQPSDEFDPWAEGPDPDDPWAGRQPVPSIEQPAREHQSAPPVRATVLSLALWAAGWWLRRGGRPAVALGVGLAAALAALAGGRPVSATLELAGATGELIGLESVFHVGSRGPAVARPGA
jgi:hypothetical protein